VLNLLEQGDWHGYEMVQALKRINGLRVREGNIYPILARLQTDGLVTGNRESSPDGPPRKSFKLSPLGRKALAEMNAHWDQIIDSIERVRRGVKT
jgi:PadR family transcriptional regulator PadR